MRKLNMWHRVAVVLTGSWWVTSGIYWVNEIRQCSPQLPWNCDFLVSNASGSSAWFWVVPNQIGLWRLGVWGDALFAVFLFPALGWLALWILIGLVKWVWAGRGA